MCGILVHIEAKKDEYSEEMLHNAAMTISYRGPDDNQRLHVDNVYFDFFRLALVGLDRANGMPICVDDCVIVANAMIYNYARLQLLHQFSLQTSNDCEIIIHLYRRFGITVMLHLLEGVFAFVLYDKRTSTVVAARDAIGIRPLFYGMTRLGSITFASEPVALAKLCDARISEFQPGSYMTVMSLRIRENEFVLSPASFVWWMTNEKMPQEDEHDTRGDIHKYISYGFHVYELLRSAVQKRLLGERPVGCLLSGGLDSSFVAALVADEMKKRNRAQLLHTFSIGLPESPDLLAARKVALHIGSFHHEVVVTEQQMLDHQQQIVRITQSPDVTTNRASTAQSLLCKYISEKTDIKIVFNGDCSEEIFASYKYSRAAPNDQAFYEDNKRLIDEVHFYDVLRSDRCIAHYGLDARTPFADRQLVEYVMRIPPKFKRHDGKTILEKYMLRLYAQQFLPMEIAWRPKEAFSDGVSRPERSWFSIVTEHYDKFIDSGSDFAAWAKTSRIPTKEAYFYYCRFIEIFDQKPETVRQDILQLVPRYWLPRFVGDSVTDPSARVLM